jgi:hypothetical protein
MNRDEAALLGLRSRDGFGVRSMWVAMELAVLRWMEPATMDGAGPRLKSPFKKAL